MEVGPSCHSCNRGDATSIRIRHLKLVDLFWLVGWCLKRRQQKTPYTLPPPTQRLAFHRKSLNSVGVLIRRPDSKTKTAEAVGTFESHRIRARPEKHKCRLTSWVHTVGGHNPAPPKKPWNDESPVNTNKQWFQPWFLDPHTLYPSFWTKQRANNLAWDIATLRFKCARREARA